MRLFNAPEDIRERRRWKGAASLIKELSITATNADEIQKITGVQSLMLKQIKLSSCLLLRHSLKQEILRAANSPHGQHTMPIRDL
jgi:hypothetical protein